MSRRSVLTTALFMLMLCASVAMAQPRGGDFPRWDPATVQSFSGTVLKEKDTGRGADFYYIFLKTDGDRRTVVLGPQKSLDPSLTSLAPATAVDVTGSKVEWKGKPIYLASLVRVGGKEYRLRDDQGRLLAADGQPLRKR
jgi:hypothetical protein